MQIDDKRMVRKRVATGFSDKSNLPTAYKYLFCVFIFKEGGLRDGKN